MLSSLKITTVSYLTLASHPQLLCEGFNPISQKTKNIFDSSLNSYIIPSPEHSYIYFPEKLWQSNHSEEKTKTHIVTSTHWPHSQDVKSTYQQKHLNSEGPTENLVLISLEMSFKEGKAEDFFSTLRQLPIKDIDAFLEILTTGSMKSFNAKQIAMLEQLITHACHIPANWIQLIKYMPPEFRFYIAERFMSQEAPIPEDWILYLELLPNDVRFKAIEVFIRNKAPIPKDWMNYLPNFPKDQRGKVLELFITSNALIPTHWIDKIMTQNLESESEYKWIQLLIENGAPIPEDWFYSLLKKLENDQPIDYLIKIFELFNKQGAEIPQELLYELLLSKSENVRSQLAQVCKKIKLQGSFVNTPNAEGITLLHKEAREGNLDILDCFLPHFDEQEIILNPKAFFSLETLRSCNSSTDIELLSEIPSETLAEPLTVAQNFCEAKVKMKDGSIRTFKHTKAEQLYQLLAVRKNAQTSSSPKTWTIYMSPDHAFGALGKDKSFGLYPLRDPLTTLHILPHVGFSTHTGQISSEEKKIKISNRKNFPKITFFISEEQENAIQVKTRLQHTSYHVIFRNCVSFMQEVYTATKSSGYFADFLTRTQFEQFNIQDFDNYKALGVAYIESTYGTEIPEIIFINTIILTGILAINILKYCFETLSEELKSIRKAQESLSLQLIY